MSSWKRPVSDPAFLPVSPRPPFSLLLSFSLSPRPVSPPQKNPRTGGTKLKAPRAPSPPRENLSGKVLPFLFSCPAAMIYLIRQKKPHLFRAASRRFYVRLFISVDYSSFIESSFIFVVIFLCFKRGLVACIKRRYYISADFFFKSFTGIACKFSAAFCYGTIFRKSFRLLLF